MHGPNYSILLRQSFSHLAKCSLRRMAISMIAAAASAWLLTIITSQLLQETKLLSVSAEAGNASQWQQQQQKQQQKDVNHQERRLPPAMLPSETPRFRQRCSSLNLPGGEPVDHTPLPFLLGSSETEGPSCRGDIFLLVIVQSAVQNRHRRNLIRRTWGSVTNIEGDRLAMIFFVGRSESPSETAALRSESSSQADIVQGNFIDTYRNVTYKHLYALRWIGERCESVRYVMKVEDDVVLNLFELRVALSERVASVVGDFFYCQINRKTKPIRSGRSKWIVTKEEWPEDVYPEYCQGFGHVMTGGLVAQLHHCAKWRRYFWVEDIFISGVLAGALGARRVQWEDGFGGKDMHPRLVGPEVAQLVIVNDGGNVVSPKLHTQVWHAILRYSGLFGCKT